MNWYHWISLITALFACIASMYQVIRLIVTGRPTDYSVPAGKGSAGIKYAFTGAMNPLCKESAFLHLPTYAAGLIYHLGIFLSLFLFPFIWLSVDFHLWFELLVSGILAVSAGCGIGIFVKRIVTLTLYKLSCPEDYFANIIVTIFLISTVIALNSSSEFNAYFIIASLIFLYFPAGKLKHALYFFAARYYLGLFFGRRGVWPPVNTKNQ